MPSLSFLGKPSSEPPLLSFCTQRQSLGRGFKCIETLFLCCRFYIGKIGTVGMTGTIDSIGKYTWHFVHCTMDQAMKLRKSRFEKCPKVKAYCATIFIQLYSNLFWMMQNFPNCVTNVFLCQKWVYFFICLWKIMNGY